MTDREKALVLNGVRIYAHAVMAIAGVNHNEADRRILNTAIRMGITPELLEETRVEQQLLMEHVLENTRIVIDYGY